MQALPSLVAACAGTPVSPTLQYDAFDPNAAGNVGLGLFTAFVFVMLDYRSAISAFAGLSVAYLAVETVVFLLLTIGLDSALTNPSVRRAVTRDPTVVDAPYSVDEDVAAEAARIQTVVGGAGAYRGGSMGPWLQSVVPTTSGRCCRACASRCLCEPVAVGRRL
jgi:hypothetical protein